MGRSRPDLDRVFAAANHRLAELEPERCRSIELAQTKAIRLVGPRPPMLRALLERMEGEPPSESWRERCHHTLRRLYGRIAREELRSETLQTALNAYLDGQTELAAQWLDRDTLLRPWGER